MTSHRVSRQALDDNLCTIAELSNDVLGLIFDIATYDATWDDYLPSSMVYAGSPLAVALNISHVCRRWRGEIVATGYIWGRLLNTSYFPTYKNSLWKQVYLRSGETSPIWLRHVDRTPTEMSTKRLTQRQMYQFVHMFLLVVTNVSPHRIRRLELSIWHREFLWNIPARVKTKMRRAITDHATHVKVGNMDANHRGGWGPSSQDVEEMDLSQHKHAQATSLMMLELVFGDTLRHPSHAPTYHLRELGFYGISVDIKDLLLMLKAMPLLEELHLEARPQKNPEADPTDVISDIVEAVSPSEVASLPYLQRVSLHNVGNIAMLLIPTIIPRSTRALCIKTTVNEPPCGLGTQL